MARQRRQPGPGGHRFSEVPRANIQRSQFDRSFSLKTAFNAGLLIPIFVDEALPGDTYNVRMQGFARLATPLKPIMDNLYMETFFFAVPNRLLWDNWQKFNGEQDDPGDSTDFVIPQVTDMMNVTSQSLGDYMGIPPGVYSGAVFSALPFRAYNRIWNDWFRDENLQDSIPLQTDDGPDEFGFTIRRRGKRHDYFTSALPWPQKGPSVELPLGASAPVVPDGTGQQIVLLPESGTASAMRADGSAPANLGLWGGAGPGVTVTFHETGLMADLTAATAATINDLRQAFQVQKLFERDARGGTRYTEIIKSHFGVTSPDARLQRSEYLGGGSSPINISPVAQTSSTDATTPQANLSGIGTAQLGGHGFTKSFTEHCVLIGLISVRADLNYQQGLERFWSRRTRFDFYWPALAHLGEQTILNKEIFVQHTAADEDVFGYQERYAEYRYKPSLITGKMRSTAAGSLDIWHLAQDFSALPVLNASFIEDNPPIDRVIAVPTEPHFLFDAHFKIKAARPMPLYGVPGLIDHF